MDDSSAAKRDQEGADESSRSSDTNGFSMATRNGLQVLQRSLGTLAETEIEEGMAEIRKLDSQIDHLSNYMEKVERRNVELNNRLQSMLEEQRKERLKRQASLYQRQQESKEQQAEFNNQVQAMLMRCQQARCSKAQGE